MATNCCGSAHSEGLIGGQEQGSKKLAGQLAGSGAQRK